MRKCYLMVALGAIFFTQMQNLSAQEHSATIELHSWQEMPMPQAISDNGKYVGGLDGFASGGYIWNTLTGEYSFFEGESSLIPVNVWDIADDGTAVADYHDKPATYKGGEWITYDMPEGWQSAIMVSVTPKGDRIVGWGMNKGYKSPCAWFNGQVYALKMPTEDLTGKKPQSVATTKISPDGSVIYGFSREDHGYFGAGIVWRNFGDDPSTVKPEVILMDQITSEAWESYNILAVSGDGKWIAGYCGVITPNPEIPGEMIVVPHIYRYNMETGNLQMVTDVEVDSGNGDTGVSAVDNQGTIFSHSVPQAGGGNPYTRFGYISEVGKPTQKIEDYLKENYNLDMTATLYFPGCIAAISADARAWVVLGAKVDEYEGICGQEALIKLDGGSPAGISGAMTEAMNCVVNGKILQFEGVSYMEVINMDGRVLYGASLNANSVSLEHLSAGIYTVKMSDGKNVKVQKIALGR